MRDGQDLVEWLTSTTDTQERRMAAHVKCIVLQILSQLMEDKKVSSEVERVIAPLIEKKTKQLEEQNKQLRKENGELRQASSEVKRILSDSNGDDAAKLALIASVVGS